MSKTFNKETFLHPKVKTAIIGSLLLGVIGLPFAHAASMTTDVLLQSIDLTPMGAIRLPKLVDSAGNGFDYGGAGLAFSPTQNALYINGHVYDNLTAEVGIPTLSGSTQTLSAIAVAPPILGLVDFTEGHYGNILAGGGHASFPRYGGNLIYNNRFIGTNFEYYDVSNVPRLSHFTNSLTTGAFQGFYAVGNTSRTDFVSGYMTQIPSEWQAALGGPALTGNCCLGIIYNTSYGPAVSVFNPDDLGSVNPVLSTEVLSYDASHGSLWGGGGVVVGGVVFPAGTRSVLFFGRRGAGNPCTGVGTSNLALDRQPVPGVTDIFCYDPTDGGNGIHDYPYTSTIWAYDANDLVAVKNGTKNSWDVLPYGIWNLPTVGGGQILGAAYDPATQRIYISQSGGEMTYPTEVSPLSFRPLIQVFHVNTTAPPAYTCPGVLCSGTAVTGSPNQAVCGPGAQIYECTLNGWQSAGPSCACGGLPPPPPPFTCPGTLCDGSSVTGNAGDIACGSGSQNFQCSANGWQNLGTACPCTSASSHPVITSPSPALGTVGLLFSYQITATNNPTSFGYSGSGWPAGLLLGVTGLISGVPTTAGTYTVTISASNSAGVGSASLQIVISPALPPAVNCGGLKICGNITAAENPAMRLPGAPLELRESHGKFLAHTKTGDDGSYTFSGLTANSTYYVGPVVGATQSSIPLQIAVPSLVPLGTVANFQVRGWLESFKIISSQSGSIVLISTTPYLSNTPPSLVPNSTSRQYFSTTTTGWDGTTTIPVAIGPTYYLTCWKPFTSGTAVHFDRTSTSSSSAPHNLVANVVTPIACD